MRLRKPSTSSAQGKSSQLQPRAEEKEAGAGNTPEGASALETGVSVQSGTVGVKVGVRVEVKEGVTVRVGVAVSVGVKVGVSDGVTVGVSEGVTVRVGV